MQTSVRAKRVHVPIGTRASDSHISHDLPMTVTFVLSIDDLLPIPDGTGTPSAQTTPIILAKDYLMTGDDDVEFYHLVYAYAPQNFS